MTTQRKTVLVAGLGATVSDTARETLNFDPSQTEGLVAAQVEKAKAEGVDCTVFIVEPWDPTGTLEKLHVELDKRDWDGFSIGYAVRALKENSVLFEEIVNLAVQTNPKMKFVFPLGRTDIWEAIQRSFALQK